MAQPLTGFRWEPKLPAATRSAKPMSPPSFEAWEQRCVRTESGVDPCQLYKLLKDAQGNNVAEFTMFGLPAGSTGPAVAGATFIAPLETLLTSGMRLQIDEGASKVYPFTFCAAAWLRRPPGLHRRRGRAMKTGANAVDHASSPSSPPIRTSLVGVAERLHRRS